MKITREQYNKWNEQAKGGFAFDLQNFAVWGEKELFKRVKQAGGSFIQFQISWRSEFTTYTNEWGVVRNIETGRHIPTLNISKWKPTPSGAYVSHGLGEDITLGTPETSKKYNVLCKLSALVDTDKLVAERIA